MIIRVEMETWRQLWAIFEGAVANAEAVTPKTALTYLETAHAALRLIEAVQPRSATDEPDE